MEKLDSVTLIRFSTAAEVHTDFMNAMCVNDDEVVFLAALWVETLFPRPMAKLNPESKFLQ